MPAYSVYIPSITYNDSFPLLDEEFDRFDVNATFDEQAALEREAVMYEDVEEEAL